MSPHPTWFVPPENFADLRLEITARAKQPHFAVDPGWPPPAPDPVEHRPADWKPKPKRVPHVFRKPHTYAVTCPMCGALPGRKCRDHEGRACFSHWSRSYTAWGCSPQKIARALKADRAEWRAALQPAPPPARTEVFKPRIEFFEEEDIPMFEGRAAAVPENKYPDGVATLRGFLGLHEKHVRRREMEEP